MTTTKRRLFKRSKPAKADKPLKKVAPKVKSPSKPKVVLKVKLKDKALFPKNPRFFTEHRFVLSLSVVFFGLCVVMAMLVAPLIRDAISLISQRENLSSQERLWEDISQKFPGYRDAYFQIAEINYQLGDREKAKEYAVKALAVDPNFLPARSLLKLIELHGE